MVFDVLFNPAGWSLIDLVPPPTSLGVMNIQLCEFNIHSLSIVSCYKLRLNIPIWGVQVALRLDEPKTIEREFGNLLKIKDNYPKFVVTNDRFYGNTFNGIKHIYIREFLISESIL